VKDKLAGLEGWRREHHDGNGNVVVDDAGGGPATDNYTNERRAESRPVPHGRRKRRAVRNI
jgi:hypothetical protein